MHRLPLSIEELGSLGSHHFGDQLVELDRLKARFGSLLGLRPSKESPGFRALGRPGTRSWTRKATDSRSVLQRAIGVDF